MAVGISKPRLSKRDAKFLELKRLANLINESNDRGEVLMRFNGLKRAYIHQNKHSLNKNKVKRLSILEKVIKVYK